MKKECKHHGLTEHAVHKNGRVRCKKCNVENVQKRRLKIKQMAVDYKGGECECCGYDKYQGALEFHHLDPNQKDFAIGHKGHSKGWEKVKKELQKCIMVCSNCHKEIHAGLIDINSGVT